MKNALPKMLAVMLIVLTTTSCAWMTGSVETSAPPPAARFCETYEPILWSQQDTDETIRQVKRENAKWKAICERSEDGTE